VADSGTDPTQVFESEKLFEDWDDDYYHPLALQLFDRVVGEMLRDIASPGDLVLDAGCGPGVHSVRAAKAGYRVQAIDVSETVLARARRYAQESGVADRIEFQRENLTSLGLADASHEAIFSWGVLTHIPDIGDALGHLARVLAPGGRLAIEITNQQAWDLKIEGVARRILGRTNPDLERLEMGTGCFYGDEGEKLWVWQANVARLTAELARHGLRAVDRRPVQFTHFQRHVKGPVRTALLHLNNAWQRAGLSAVPAATNLLIYEKPA
jgi:SAM-dependent methyltransferase